MKLQEGDKIGAYAIVAPLGQGGMATVYKAYHERLDRHVALKLMHETFLQDDDFRARFQREARIVAKLEHSHIVPIYDYNEYDGVPYLVMKFIAGMTLKRHAIKVGLTLEETRDMLTDIAKGLDYAHTQGILHRDMKPSNILIDKTEQPYITDFGLARIAEAGASTISHDMMLGTPFYISPEQAQGDKDLDSRTDIYSLAVILYELITGRVPFQADTPYAIVHGHIYTQPERPSYINNDLTDAIDAVLMRGLAKDRQDRYPTAVAMMQAFGEALAETPDSPRIDARPIDGGTLVLNNEGEPDIAPRVGEVSRYDDLGDNLDAYVDGVLEEVDESLDDVLFQAQQPSKHRVKVDAEFDLGDMSWREIPDRFRTGVQSLAEMIEERIDTELRQRRGIELTEEELVRRRVLKRMKDRKEFIGNLSSYIGVNAVLIGIWFFTGAGFFWPFFPLFFWGMGVASHGYDYYSKYGPGADKRQALFEEEVRRELGRARGDKPKKEREERYQQAGSRLEVDDLASNGRGVRINDEGELTDSFIEEQGRR